MSAAELLDPFYQIAIERFRNKQYGTDLKTPEGERLLAAPMEDQAESIVLCFERMKTDEERRALANYLSWQAYQKVKLSTDQLCRLAPHLVEHDDFSHWGKQIVDRLEAAAKRNSLTESETSALKELEASIRREGREDFFRKHLERIAKLTSSSGAPGRFGGLAADDAWAIAAIKELSNAAAARKQAWSEVLLHAATLSATKPTAAWLKAGRTLIEKLSGSEFDGAVARWFELVGQKRPKPPRGHSPLILNNVNCDALKGLVWLCTLRDDPRVTRAVGQLAVHAFHKIPGVGARSEKVGNACVHALASLATTDALGQLAFLKMKVKRPAAQKQIDKAMAESASRLQIDADELLEMSVPAYGLTEVGRLDEPLGDFTIELAIEPSGKANLAWRKPDGKLQKSIPAAIKADFPDELKELKSAVKDIEKMVSAQRERLEQLFLRERRWPVDLWRERYFDHPLVGFLARRLIWVFRNTGLERSGAWLGETVVDVDDEPIDWIDSEGTTVELWHPIGKPMDDVLAWRGWLDRHEVRQPFKQAHREVYVLTDAERRTATYSNRYAAHILKQHQFQALCTARGWKNRLRLMVDAEADPPTIHLKHWGLRAELWVDTVGDAYGTDTTDSGAYLYLSTDQVRFYRLEADRHVAHATGGRYVTEGLDIPLNQPLPLEIIPPIVFSEVMRDVDLFVGVASVGNDPTWADGGPAGRYRDYWQAYSFGDLTPSAQTRKQVLERLVPKLKIGPRCSFSEKFLVVRGELRTYKIHLGSGNILMEPNDQYLCIVPESPAVSKAENVFLPFEGDRTLSIVLSKAMLLAEDRSISDPTITRQIRSGS